MEEQQGLLMNKGEQETIKLLQKAQEQVSKGLTELQGLLKEGRDGNDATVKAIEDQIRVALDVPKESWGLKHQSLTELIDNVSRHLQELQNSHHLEWISDKLVLQNASGGLCLEGVYQTGNLEDFLTKREQLIEVPESFSLRGPEQSSTYDQKQFYSHKSESDFQTAMERHGFSCRFAVKVGFLGFGIENTTETSYSAEKEEKNTHSSEQSYICNIKYNYIPLASSFIEKETLRLSQEAINELQNIEKILLNSNDKNALKDRVVKFFHRFGSHANQGVMHFGGIFWWRASAEGFSSSDLSEMKSLISDALNVYVGAAYSEPSLNFSAGAKASSSEVKGCLSSKHSERLMNQVHLSVRKTGGPAAIDDHLKWKVQLASSNTTWNVIDRGTTFVPVWEIICAHKQVFTDADNLSTELMQIYKDCTKQNVEPMSGENVLSAIERANVMMQTVKHWTTSESDVHLAKLLEFKSQMKDETGSYNIWIHTCLSSEALQNYLLDVAKANEDPTAVNLRVLMRALLEPPCDAVRSEIKRWAYQSEEYPTNILVSDCYKLIEILKQTKEELEGVSSSNSTEFHSAKVKATCKVTLSINSLCQTLRDKEQEEAEVLILSIVTVLGYSKKNKTFDHLLDPSEIDFLQTKIENEYEAYSRLKGESVLKGQAFLILAALTSTMGDHKVPAEEKGKRLNLIQCDLKSNLSDTIKSAIETCDNDWEMLESEIKSIVESGFDKRNINEKITETPLRDLPMNPVVAFAEDRGCEKSEASDKNEMGSFRTLLQKLALGDFYPKKMKLKDILVIDSFSLNENRPETETQLTSLYLYKLMMLDYRARNIFFKPEATATVSEAVGTCVDDDDIFEIDPETCSEIKSEESHIHPMDVHMAVFHCASDFLRQRIFSKLTACQFALPFLVPNPYTGEVEFPLWPLRHIKKSWQSSVLSNTDNPGKYKDRQMFNTPVPCVSFIRLGTSSSSKSQILNAVISKQKHNVFFSRHCKGSTPKCLLANGVVEIAWYCPGGKEDDIFDNCVAFLNLHGDAKKHPQQLEFLQQVSTVMVVLLTEHQRDEETTRIGQSLSKSSIPLICLFSGQESMSASKNPMKVRLAAKNRNEAELTEELITNIKQQIDKCGKTMSIEMCCEEARKQLFRVDEDKVSFKDGFSQAQTLVCILKEQNISTTKERFLPLQGQLWQSWCMKNKELFRLQCNANESLEIQISRINNEMKAIRHEQYQKATPLNDFMKSFLDCLTSDCHSEDTKFYMLQWLRILLDELISDAVAGLKMKYHTTWSNMRKLPNNKDKTLEVDKHQKQLNAISFEMTAVTVGLQHIMREVGQLYEAILSTMHGDSLSDKSVNALPAVGAEMLISGYPLELMDGDASHVPLMWILAVLDKVIEKLGDKKVYVLSVLGLQSSGKSTLLNTMFGVQFAVSTGRCTRGAFMQLLTVDANTRDELGYDFLLIVDTEGLRSPELSTESCLKHDNELATFVIGIGDMTVINIMGENPSEMQEILQICVQAFLRMKQVKIQPSCVFVHQNVAEASAGDNNMEGRRRLQDKLDEMADMAAKEEQIEDVHYFSDIIKFDVGTQVFYFKNLLEGDPPMAPPNPSYSQNVQELKTRLLSVAKWQTDCRFSSLSEFRLRVRDLWKALLQENFVFSFRNTLEMAVYSNLEDKYVQWSWELRKHALETQNTMENKIGSNLIQNVSTKDLMKIFDQVYDPLKDKTDTYFQQNKHAEVLIKWKVNIETRFESLKKELIEETRKKCEELLAIKKSRSEQDKKKCEYEAKLLQASKSLASSLKEKRLNDSEVEEEFDKLWVDWTTKVADDQRPEGPVNVKAAVERVLLDRFQKQPDILTKITENGQFEFLKEKHARYTGKWKLIGWIEEYFYEEHTLEKCAEQLNDNVNKTVEKYIKEKENRQTDFNEIFIYEMLNKIEEDIAAYEQNENIKFTKEFRADLSVHVCLKSAGRFQKMHEKFRQVNNPLTYLESKRNQYLQMFQNCCKGASSVKIFVDFLLRNIQSSIYEATREKTSLQTASVMKSENPAFNGNRSNLENHIMRHLASQEKFEDYAEYIRAPQKYFEKFIEEEIQKFSHQSLNKFFHENLSEIKTNILCVSTEVCNEVKDKQGRASMWLDQFCQKLGDRVVININDLKSIENEDINDFTFFQKLMAKSLEEMVEDMKKKIVETSDLGFFIAQNRVHGILLKQLGGCWVQCPFCSAVCTNTIVNHSGDHSVQFHRPAALRSSHYDKSKEFCIDFCTSLVSSNINFNSGDKWIPCKSYRDAGDPFDIWSITADGSTQGYWKWFICKFQKDLENKYGFKFEGNGKIPEDWKNIEKEAVLKELS